MAYQYFFVIGRSPALSAGELARVVSAEGWQVVNGAIIITCQSQLDSKSLMQKLGGSIKIGKVIATVPRRSFPEWLTKLRWKNATGQGKFHFGFSDYTTPRIEQLKKHGLALKRALAAGGVQSRLVTSRESQLSSVIVAKNHLLNEGVELCLFGDAETVLVGQTEAVQDFEAFGQRDFGRPSHQAKAGMLPPKVARMMIHLADPRPTDSLIDPFCGAGTVLQEALDVGLTEVVGSDIDHEAIGIATKNLQWYIRTFAPDKKMPQIIQSDILQLHNRLLKRQFNCIVAEGYLGPPLTPRVPQPRREQIYDELQGFYQRAIPLLTQLLTSRGRMVLALPAVSIQKQWHSLRLAEAYQRSGLTIEPIVPEAYAHAFHQHGVQVIYSRPDQQIGREIVILKKSGT